jgi:acetylglutamate kinase
VKLLIKIGGTLIDTSERRLATAGKVAAIAGLHQTVVVHGGGKQLSHYLKEHGIESEFRGGLRVTPPHILDAVIRTLAGVVNHRLVAALQECGVQAVGLSGIDAGIAQARQLSPAMGAVGEVETVDPALLELLSSRGYLPTVACIAGGRQSDLQRNADQMAVAVAGAFRLTSSFSHGCRRRPGRRQAALSLVGQESVTLIETGVAHGGMEAKLRSAMAGIAECF